MTNETAIREQIAADLTAFADKRRASAYRYAPELDICTRKSNDCVVNAYYTAAAIARDGMEANPACENCKSSRGGALGHSTEECTWEPCDTAGSNKEHV